MPGPYRYVKLGANKHGLVDITSALRCPTGIIRYEKKEEGIKPEDDGNVQSVQIRSPAKADEADYGPMGLIHLDRLSFGKESNGQNTRNR